MAARLTAVAVALIVGVTLVAGLIVGAQRDDDTGPIDLLIYNGRVYTGNASAPFAEAVAIRGNRIYRVGSNREIKRLRRRATTVIDAHGGSVLPGFSDAHARLPVVPDTPATIAAPAVSTSPAAPASQSPPVATRTASADVAQPAAPSEPAAVVREAIEGAHRLGVTALNTVAEGAELAAYQTLRRDEQLPLRVVAALRVTAPVDAAMLERLDAVRTAHRDDPVFRVDAAALRVTLPPPVTRAAGRRGRTASAKTATLPADITTALNALDQHGWNVVLQVDDERALSAALDALSTLGAAPAGGRERRHRVELSRPMALDVPRIKALGVAVSLPLPATWAPGHALVDDASTAETPVAEAPTASAESAASTIDSHSGLRLLMASEALVDPRLGLQALLAGPETSDGAPPSTEPVAEAALAAAIDVYTSTAAWASGDERRRGAIARDMLADIVILSADLFTLSADKLLDAVVTVTIFDGKVVYDREAEAAHSTDQ